MQRVCLVLLDCFLGFTTRQDCRFFSANRLPSIIWYYAFSYMFTMCFGQIYPFILFSFFLSLFLVSSSSLQIIPLLLTYALSPGSIHSCMASVAFLCNRPQPPGKSHYSPPQKNNCTWKGSVVYDLR